MESDRLNTYRGKIIASRQRRRRYLLLTISAFVSVLSITIINQSLNSRTVREVETIVVAVPEETLLAVAEPEVLPPTPISTLQLDQLDQFDNLMQELAAKSFQIEEMQLLLVERESKVEELLLAQELFQAELDNAYKDLEGLQQVQGDLEVARRDLQNLKQVVDGFPSLLGAERLVRAEEAQKSLTQLNELQQSSEAAKLAYQNELQILNNKNIQYKKALDENSLFVASLEEELSLRLAKEAQPSEMQFDLQQMRQELVELQENYQQERTLRLSHEAQLSQKEAYSLGSQSRCTPKKRCSKPSNKPASTLSKNLPPPRSNMPTITTKSPPSPKPQLKQLSQNKIPSHHPIKFT